MRLIDADAFARWLDKEHYVDKPTGKCDDRQNRVLGIAISAAKNPEICPTIDAVPVVHGRWLTSSDIPDRLICSVCGRRFDMYHFDQKDMPFCLCGAKMDGGAGR